ncbi:MAG: T9SS type A sorting domain-containing protein [Lentimicrobium sp.]|nr:T9SS type A sorting domain-containing protein [Lentimicrobium sp.]
MKNIISVIFITLTFILASWLQADAQKQTTGFLSDTIDVVHYNLQLDLTGISSQYIKGTAEIRLTTPLQNISHIPLNLIQLQVDSVLSESNSHLIYYHEGDLLRITAPSTFSEGDTVIIKVYYQGTPFHESWGGFHFYNPWAFNLGVGFQSIPHNLGKSWFPCIDDFTDRAFYDYHIRVNTGDVAVCGGLLQSVSTMCDETIEFWWKSDRSIPTYLASVAAGPYAMITDTYTGLEAEIPVTWFVRPQDTLKVAGSFLNLNAITSIFENSFGPYPFQRIGFTGTNLGAMEHAENIAYPHGSINGNLSNEWLYAHELSHMWFGNMVTCASDADMWLNEGWARWCETLYREHLYGIVAARNNMRTLKREVLRYAHISEGGYLPLSPMPQNLTYGTHVYDKGGMVTHGLRGYLGDSLFFDGIKAYLEAFAWKSASSIQMRNFLTQYTGTDLQGFFDFHVFGPGYNHVAIDSFSTMPQKNGFEVEVFVKQKLKGAEIPAVNCRTELAFMNSSREIETRTIDFSGFTGSEIFNLASEPELIMVDPFGKFNGATTTDTKTLKSTGIFDFTDTYFKMEVTEIADSAFLHVAHNWVHPDSLAVPLYGLTLSDYRYWIINGILPSGFKATGRFTYNRANYLDHTLISGSTDSLVILYRPNASHDWQPVPFTKTGVWVAGTIYVPDLQPGEYTLAVWDEEVVKSRYNKLPSGEMMQVFPNPCKDWVDVSFSNHSGGTIFIMDTSGKVLEKNLVSPGQKSVGFSTNHMAAGNYLLQFSADNGEKKMAKLIIAK